MKKMAIGKVSAGSELLCNFLEHSVILLTCTFSFNHIALDVHMERWL